MQTRKTTRQARTNLSASMADLRSVVRFNSLNNNSFLFGFILDETLQLKERPIANPIVYYFSSSLFSYAFEVFHYNLVSIKVGNNVLADVMINPLHITSFSSAYLPEKTLGRKSAFFLKFGTQISELSFDLLDFGRIIKPSVTTDSEVVYSEVNAKNSSLRATVHLRSSDLFRECEDKEASAFFINPKQAFTNFPTEVFLITFWDVKLKLLSCLEQSQNQLIPLDISTSWKIISDRSFFDNRFCLGSLSHSTSLSHTSYSYLGRELEFLPNCLVDSIMEFEVLSDFMFPRIINTELQGFSVSLDSSNYLFGWIDSDFSTNSCSHIDYKTQEVVKSFGGEFAFLPTLKGWVSSEHIL